MSLDRRLREGFGRLTADLEPDVGRHFETARRVAHRRASVRRASTAGVVAAAIVLVAVAAWPLLDALRSERPATDPDVATPATIAGTYTSHVRSGPALVDERGLAGTWTFELQPDGEIFVTPPETYVGFVARASFDVEGALLRTDVFVNDLCDGSQRDVPPGEYTWQELDGNLVLGVRSDACPARVAILSEILRAA